MRIFAISDLHLSLKDGVLARPQDRFGAEWKDHHEKIERDWRAQVQDHDLVLVAGDISWASRPADAEEDMAWIHRLPGRKVMVKGNHDWWASQSRAKARALLPESIHLIWDDCILIEDVLVFGTRLWTIPGLAFPDVPGDPEEDAKILEREMKRLRASIAAAEVAEFGSDIRLKICMTHFPPTDLNGTGTEVTELLSSFGTDECVFGHVHGFREGSNGVEVGGTRYFLTSCDYLGFRLLPVRDE